MRKKLSRRDFLRLSAAGTAGFAACASGIPLLRSVAGRPHRAFAQDTSEVTVLWRTNPGEIATMEEAFAAFEALNPNINVDFQQAPQGLEGEGRLQAMFAAGEPPEVFASVFAAGLVDYVYRDFCADLTPLIARDSFDQGDFFDVALEP
jgi:ABC-type glycerol-3-phosphate transport system substrate-binding protein